MKKKFNKFIPGEIFWFFMENLMVIWVEVIAPENLLDSDYNICKRPKITLCTYDQ
jgi:hypothetical protein